MILIEDQPIFIEEYDLIEKQAQERRGFSYLNKLKSLAIGSGNNTFKADKNGIWLGAEDFDLALFRVALDGDFHIGGITNHNIEYSNNKLIVDGSFIRRDFHWFTIFESIDGYYTAVSGGGESVTLNGESGVDIAVGTTGNARIRRKLEVAPIALTWDKDRILRVTISLGNSTKQTIFIRTGSLVGASSRHIGFRITDNTIYGSVGDGTTEDLTDLGTIATGTHRLEVDFTTGSQAAFYVDGVLEGATADNLPSGLTGADYLLQCYLGSTDVNPKSMSIYSWEVWQAV